MINNRLVYEKYMALPSRLNGRSITSRVLTVFARTHLKDMTRTVTCSSGLASRDGVSRSEPSHGPKHAHARARLGQRIRNLGRPGARGDQHRVRAAEGKRIRHDGAQRQPGAR